MSRSDRELEPTARCEVRRRWEDGRPGFDAGELGCADGLAAAFRRAMAEIPVGDVLVVSVRDPAAKEDLPPLARMMGHVVRSIEPAGGALEITVERGG